MKSNVQTTLKQLTLPVAIAAALAGCSALEVKPQAIEAVKAVKKGPEQVPHRSITGFSDALRCMDDRLIDYGVRDISMLVEEIPDQTKKVNAGTRDMLISAVSDMTKRSRAIRLIAFGKDATNIVSFYNAAQRQSPYQVVPQFNIKGSITQWDENVIRNQKDLGVGLQPYVNLGASRDAAASILGLDLSVMDTTDMAIMSGVTSRNSVVIFKEGQGVDGDAAYRKFGVSFALNFSRSEGQSQALRGLVELAVIELMGRLTKTPYWQCLGADPTREEIRLEIADWYHAMASSPGEIVAYFQNQMLVRGFYKGPIDGRFNPAIDEAIASYRAALGLSREAVIDRKFFAAFLDADHTKVKRPEKPFVADVPAPTADATTSAATTTPAAPATTSQAPKTVPASFALTMMSGKGQGRGVFERGESIALMVVPSRDAHLYCYLQDENKQIVRFFPNRFSRDSLVRGQAPVAFPGKAPFQLVANQQGVKETVACYATDADVLATLPKTVTGVDFEPLPVGSVEELRAAFAATTKQQFGEGLYHVEVR